MAEARTKAELTAELERARARMSHHGAHLRHDLDVASHVRESFHRNKAAYLGGASFLGLILAKLPARKKKVYVESKGEGKAIKQAEKAGIWILLLQFLFKTLQPTLGALLAKQLNNFVKSGARD